MWNTNGAGNSWGNKVPLFLADRNTVIVQNHAACVNVQFSNITDQGYLKMIEMKVPSKGQVRQQEKIGIMVLLLSMDVELILHIKLIVS